jgi:hypothetical protein
MGINKKSPKHVERALRLIRAGLPGVLKGGKQMFFRQKFHALGSLASTVDAALQPIEDAHAAALAKKRAVAARKKNHPHAAQLVDDVELAARNTFGESSPEYFDLGFEPPKKPRKATADEKNARIKKQLETKAARGLLGKGAKKKRKKMGG